MICGLLLLADLFFDGLRDGAGLPLLLLGLVESGEEDSRDGGPENVARGRDNLEGGIDGTEGGDIPNRGRGTTACRDRHSRACGTRPLWGSDRRLLERRWLEENG